MLKKSQFESLILCKDRDFKHRSVNFLNGIAFNAEKHNCESVEETITALEANPKILNLIIDGNDFSSLLLENDHAGLKQLCNRPGLMAVLYLPEDKFNSVNRDHKISNLFVYSLPFEKPQFNMVFHNRGSKDQAGSDNPAGPLSVFQSLKPSGGAPQSPGPESKPDPKKNVIAFETSGHVKDSLAMINIIAKNREALDQIIKVGQLFNGLVGALAYFENKEGYKELRNLAMIVDEISRFYEDKKKPAISDVHFRIFYHSAVNSFKLLQILRENKTIDPALLKDASQLQADFSQLEEFKGKHTCDQEEIDKLLEKPS